jgi:hypothetical protein
MEPVNTLDCHQWWEKVRRILLTLSETWFGAKLILRVAHLSKAWREVDQIGTKQE